MPQYAEYLSTFQTPNASFSCGNQQNEDVVSELLQRVTKLETLISKKPYSPNSMKSRYLFRPIRVYHVELFESKGNIFLSRSVGR